MSDNTGPPYDSFLIRNGFEEELPNAMRKAFEEMGLREVEIDQKPDHRIKPSASLADFDLNSCILSDDFSEIMDLLSQGYFLRESAFREMRSLR